MSGGRHRIDDDRGLLTLNLSTVPMRAENAFLQLKTCALYGAMIRTSSSVIGELFAPDRPR